MRRIFVIHSSPGCPQFIARIKGKMFTQGRHNFQNLPHSSAHPSDSLHYKHQRTTVVFNVSFIANGDSLNSRFHSYGHNGEHNWIYSTALPLWNMYSQGLPSIYLRPRSTINASRRFISDSTGGNERPSQVPLQQLHKYNHNQVIVDSMGEIIMWRW